MQPYFSQGSLVIYHGDAREVLENFSPVDLVITDPPYAVGAGNGEWAATASVAIALNLAAKLVRKGGALLAFSTTSGRGMEFTRGAVGKALAFNRLLLWHKVDSRSRVAGPWQWDAVAIMAFGVHPLAMPRRARCSLRRPSLSG
jgi:23S rRNA G2445 N2-methylase RlmL